MKEKKLLIPKRRRLRTGKKTREKRRLSMTTIANVKLISLAITGALAGIAELTVMSESITGGIVTSGITFTSKRSLISNSTQQDGGFGPIFLFTISLKYGMMYLEMRRRVACGLKNS
jgi:hypothetical protein